MSSASCAPYWRHRNQISRAFFWPTTRAREEAPRPPSKLPTRGPVLADVALVAAHALVAAAAERATPFARQDDDADLLVLACAHERIDQLHRGSRPERVVDLGPVDRDATDAFGLREGDVLVGFAALDRLPVEGAADFGSFADGCLGAHVGFLLS
jgi:hypothetical protein